MPIRSLLTPLNLLVQLSMFIVIASMYGCSDEADFTGVRVNAFASEQRTNNYTALPEQSLSTFSIDSIDKAAAGIVSKPLVLSKNEIIVSTFNYTLECLSYGNVVWKVKLGECVALATPVADESGNIYITCTDGTLRSYTREGKKRFINQCTTPQPGFSVITSSELLLLNDGVVVAFDNGLVRKYSLQGKQMWEYQSAYQPQKVFAADGQGNIALGLHSNDVGGTDSLVMLNANGTIRWSQALHQTRLTSNTMILPNGTIIIGGERRTDAAILPVLHCYTQTGQSQWSRNIPETPRCLSLSDDTSFVVTGVAHGYFSESKSSVRLHSLSTGEIQWELYYQAVIQSAAIVSESYITFVATQNTAVGVYRMNKGGANVEVLSLSDAPLFLADPAVAPNGTLVFGLKDYCGTLRVGKRAAFGLVPL